MTAPALRLGVDEAAERRAARAAEALSLPGAWLEAAGEGYRVRPAADRRRRAIMTLDEAAFAALVAAPGLRPRPEGGWSVRRVDLAPEPPPPGRRGVIDAERPVAGPDGVVALRRANLGESPIAWLMRRKGPDGQPLLSPVEAAAGERLRDDALRCGDLGRLTMDWSGRPSSGGGRALAQDPAERAVRAKARVRAALAAAGPEFAGVLEHVCIRGSALEAAERGLGLPRRSGKAVLKLAPRRLAAHYRIG